MWRIRFPFPLSAGLAALLLGLLAASCPLASGPVVGWGSNYMGEATPPPSVDGTTGTATAIAAGFDHSCAIQAGTGAVVCWGDDQYGQATPPPSVDGTTGTATAIAAGFLHTLAIRDGSCSDGLDNDGDGLIDYPADPGCTDASDLSEEPDCMDALDNDGDGLVDYPEDPGCDDALDAFETSDALPCDDGIDNDSDGRTDFDPVTFADPGDQYTLPAGVGDPGCKKPSWFSEDPRCQDGIDNDGDGMVDYDAGYSRNGVPDPDGPDPQCVNPFDNRESPCGLGVELALLLPPLMWLSRRRFLR